MYAVCDYASEPSLDCMFWKNVGWVERYGKGLKRDGKHNTVKLVGQSDFQEFMKIHEILRGKIECGGVH